MQALAFHFRTLLWHGLLRALKSHLLRGLPSTARVTWVSTKDTTLLHERASQCCECSARRGTLFIFAPRPARRVRATRSCVRATRVRRAVSLYGRLWQIRLSRRAQPADTPLLPGLVRRGLAEHCDSECGCCSAARRGLGAGWAWPASGRGPTPTRSHLRTKDGPISKAAAARRPVCFFCFPF